MLFMQYPFGGAADRREMVELVYAHPDNNLHVADLPYRLASWAFDDPHNASLWRGMDGTLLGWAALQSPFWTLDFAFHPRTEERLMPEVLAWAEDRARIIRDTPAGHPAWFAMLFAGQVKRRRMLEAAGFKPQAEAGVDAWRRVFLRWEGNTQAPGAGVPDGFTIRPLAGEGEVEAYVQAHRAAFETRNMTSEWRRRTRLQPEYLPGLDLVATDPDGKLAAFCIAWLTPRLPGGRRGQIEPLGVRPEFRGLGLGRAILGEAIRRLGEQGAAQIYVETDLYRDAALGLYEAAGFRAGREVLVMRGDVMD